MAEVNSKNYVVVQGWMVTDLKLSGNELLIYAIIYGFSQSETECYCGGIQYLTEWVNATSRTVINALNSLIKKELVKKTVVEKGGVKRSKYSALAGSENFSSGSENFSHGGSENFSSGSENFSHNNNRYNYKDPKYNDNKKPAAAVEAVIADSGLTDEVKDAFRDFAESRRQMRVPMTEKAAKLLIGKLIKMTDSTEERIAIINQSIENAWKGFYPIKTEKARSGGNKAAEELDDFYKMASDWVKEKEAEGDT